MFKTDSGDCRLGLVTCTSLEVGGTLTSIVPRATIWEDRNCEQWRPPPPSTTRLSRNQYCNGILC